MAIATSLKVRLRTGAWKRSHIDIQLNEGEAIAYRRTGEPTDVLAVCRFK